MCVVPAFALPWMRMCGAGRRHMTIHPLVRDSMALPHEDIGSSEVLGNRADAPPSPPWFLVGERERRLYPVDPYKIDYIESDGNYVTLHVGPKEYIARDTLKR